MSLTIYSFSSEIYIKKALLPSDMSDVKTFVAEAKFPDSFSYNKKSTAGNVLTMFEDKGTKDMDYITLPLPDTPPGTKDKDGSKGNSGSKSSSGSKNNSESKDNSSQEDDDKAPPPLKKKKKAGSPNKINMIVRLEHC